jgi:hypothetical protein
MGWLSALVCTTQSSLQNLLPLNIHRFINFASFVESSIRKIRRKYTLLPNYPRAARHPNTFSRIPFPKGSGPHIHLRKKNIYKSIYLLNGSDHSGKGIWEKVLRCLVLA